MLKPIGCLQCRSPGPTQIPKQTQAHKQKSTQVSPSAFQIQITLAIQILLISSFGARFSTLHQTFHSLRSLRTLGDPSFDLVHIQGQTTLGLMRVIDTQDFEETTIPTETAVRSDDTEHRTIMTTFAAETDCNGHKFK